jgi:hypothetical protein
MIILTDGCINDRNETIDAIVELANYPVSLIIVGIGNNDFTDMVMLDGDEGAQWLVLLIVRLILVYLVFLVPLVNRAGVQVSRDIVQFVPFNRHVYWQFEVDVCDYSIISQISWARRR